jgi:hypothetical protein
VTVTRPVITRLPWTAIAVSVVVLLSSGFAIEPIRDAVTGEQVAEAYLTRSPAYVALAPLSDVLDALTLMSRAQHIALVVAAFILWAFWRALLAWRRPVTVRGHVVGASALLLGILLTYVALALLPRPMASLAVNDANIVRADFHSHTNASHDGRAGWDAESNRAWHRDGGYDVAYVTDHGSVAAAEKGMALNANPAGEGTVLLQGIEVTWAGEHVNILGAERTYKGLLTPNGRDVDEQALRLASLIPNREPVVIWNHPRKITRLTAASGTGTPGVRGVEVTNGAPDSMDGVRRGHDAIVSLAREKSLTFVSGSDNHGWGRTAPNWTLLFIPGWRGLAPDALASQIEVIVRKGGAEATRVIERETPRALTSFATAATIVAVPVSMFRTMSNEERVAWLVWIWGIVLGQWLLRRRSRSAAT